MARIPELDDIRAEIRSRSHIVDWATRFPWWPRPAHVKILFYADGGIRYDGGPFFGLKQVLATLTAQHHPWVRFDLTTVGRSSDPSADHDNLDLAQALALDDFDELWIYSIASTPQLAPAELAAARTFMDDRDGGVLITGDHADLGAAFGNLPRAGKMRMLPAPPAATGVWNTSLRSGADASFDFADQSDSTPQPLELVWRWAGLLRKAPHPVLCSQLGPIDVFPDHQHEGEALAPAPAPVSEWPAGARAEIIARATIIDPSSNTVGRRFGVLSAYDGHTAKVGRIVADSTWHHHFDINLRGVPGQPDRTGFVTPGTGDWIPTARKIEAFFVNAGVWLAPPAKQRAMRAAAWWPILWSDIVVQGLDVRLDTRLLGRYAYDALGRYAPQCAVFGWIWDLVPIDARPQLLKLAERDADMPVTEFVAGVATQQLIDSFGATPSRMPTEAPDLDVIDKALQGAGERGLEALSQAVDERAESIRTVARRR